MLKAIALGALGQVSLVLSGLFATWVTVPRQVIGWLAGFGAGALICSLTFDLTEQAAALGGVRLCVWLLIGAAVFVGGDYAVDRKIGPDPSAGAYGIVLGSVVDGVPESLIFGIGVAAGNPVSVSFLAAVIVSNIPQALAPSADLSANGWSRSKLLLLWSTVVVACAVASALGYLGGSISGATGDKMAALAAGGLLAMLTNSLMPFSFERGGRFAGIATVLGFALAVAPRTF